MRVLYVCTGNSFRSTAAEALTRSLRPDLEVESAGTDPARYISSGVKSLLEQEGALQYVKPKPDEVSQRALDEADKIVCMMPGHRNHLLENFDVSEDKIHVWDIKDPVEPGVAATSAFHDIEEKVEKLER